MTTNDERRLEILKYIMERQRAKQHTTKNTVIKYMIDRKMASRQTTHNLINKLIDEGKINKEEINSQVHFLTVNEKWNKMQEEFLKSQIDKTLKMFPADALEDKVIMIQGKPISKGASLAGSVSSYSVSITSKKPKRKKAEAKP